MPSLEHEEDSVTDEEGQIDLNKKFELNFK